MAKQAVDHGVFVFGDIDLERCAAIPAIGAKSPHVCQDGELVYTLPAPALNAGNVFAIFQFNGAEGSARSAMPGAGSAVGIEQPDRIDQAICPDLDLAHHFASGKIGIVKRSSQFGSPVIGF